MFILITLILGSSPLPYLSLHGGHGQNLAPLLALQLSAHSTVDSGADGVSGLVEEDARIVVEADHGTVAALGRVLGSNNDGMTDVTTLDFVGCRHAGHATRGGTSLLLDDNDDAIT